MTEHGAAADNAVRDGAPGGAGPFARARAPRDPHCPQSLGSWKLGATAGGSQRRLKGGLANLPAPPGAPFPSFKGETEKGTKGLPRGPKTNPRDSEALSEEGVGWKNDSAGHKGGVMPGL